MRLPQRPRSEHLSWASMTKHESLSHLDDQRVGSEHLSVHSPIFLPWAPWTPWMLWALVLDALDALDALSALGAINKSHFALALKSLFCWAMWRGPFSVNCGGLSSGAKVCAEIGRMAIWRRFYSIMGRAPFWKVPRVDTPDRK